jgi:hypothetical protein
MKMTADESKEVQDHDDDAPIARVVVAIVRVTPKTP